MPYCFCKIDGRVDSIEVKIKKLDADLAQCKDKMMKMPEGSSKVKLRIILFDFHQSFFLECNEATSFKNFTAKANVRKSTRNDDATILQHGTN